MSGPWTLRESLMLAGAVLLLCSVCYFVGRKSQALSDKLSTNKNQIHVADSVVRSDSVRVRSAEKQSDILLAYRSKVREKIRVVKDSVFVRDTVYVDSTLAQVIHADDTLPKTLATERAAHEAQVLSLYKTVALRDERIKLLESQHNPRLSHGIQLGAGYCAAPQGNTPCIYAGYGFQVRL